MKKVKNDLTGQKFGRLTVEKIDERGTRKTYYWCRCDCGKLKSVRSDSLLCGAIRSCGCIKKEQDSINLQANHSHKMSHTRIYEIWQGMKSRCSNPNDKRYNRYGGRGITICDEWKNDFSAFYDWAIKNGYKETLTIDRIDNDGNYTPENCRWATIKAQCRNRSSNIRIKIGDSTKTMIEWCELFNLDYRTINARYKRHPSIEIKDLFC